HGRAVRWSCGDGLVLFCGARVFERPNCGFDAGCRGFWRGHRLSALELQTGEDFHGRWRSDVPGFPDGDAGTEAAIERRKPCVGAAGSAADFGRHYFRYDGVYNLPVAAGTAAVCDAGKGPCRAPAIESGIGTARRGADAV